MSDPIKRTSDNAITLFDKLAKEANGFHSEQVIDSAFNLIVNAIRQTCTTRDGAELIWDQLVARAKGNLMDCYGVTGRKKGVYPYHQYIRVPFTDFRKVRSNGRDE